MGCKVDDDDDDRDRDDDDDDDDDDELFTSYMQPTMFNMLCFNRYSTKRMQEEENTTKGCMITQNGRKISNRLYDYLQPTVCTHHAHVMP